MIEMPSKKKAERSVHLTPPEKAYSASRGEKVYKRKTFYAKPWKAFSLVLLALPLMSFLLPPILLNSFRQLPNRSSQFPSVKKESPPPKKEPPKKIFLEHADSLLFDSQLLPGVNKLKGNVRMRHESWLMNCDSAYLNEEVNTFDAMDNVVIRDDSINIFSKYLFYDGAERLARLRHAVELNNKSATLYTDSLDYDRNLGIGYYFQSGTIVDSLNTLTSIYGEYTPASSEAYFEKEVVLENPDFVLYTERLRYNTESKIAYFDGPTTILSDSGCIESSRGIYDTEKDVAILLDRSVVFHKRGTMTGDSLLYDNKRKFAESFGRMILNDTINRSILKGEYGYFNEKTEYAFATAYASMEDYSRKDTVYVGADTLEMVSKKEAVASETEDSKQIRLMRAYHRARLYRKGMQGVADSLTYFSHDSIFTLYQKPIIWNDSIQLEGDTIRAFFASDTLHHAKSWMNAKSMRQLDDPELFEQLKSDSILAFFAEETVREFRAFGEVDMVYFPLQESIHRYFGVGRIKGPELYVYFAADTLQKTLFVGPTEGALYPIESATDTEKKLPGLIWETLPRPQSPQDVISPMLDSLGNPLPFTPIPLSDLARFDGSLAALSAYDTIDSEIELSRRRAEELAKQKAEAAIAQKEQLSIYIRRSRPEDAPWRPAVDILNPDHLKLWDYSSTSETQENSSTSLSITIPERMPSPSE